VRRLLAILVIASLGLSLPGCSLFKKNTGGGGDGGGAPNPVPPPKFPSADSKADPLNGQSRAAGGVGVLAGRVWDGMSRPPAGTSILVVDADAKDDSQGQEVSVSPDGHFTIEKLALGGQYKLIARGKQGDRAVAGIHYATANNLLVVIQMKEDYVSTTTPAVQGPYGTLNGDKKFEPLSPQRTKETPADKGWQPASGTELMAAPPVQVAVRPEFLRENGLVIPPPLAIGPPKASLPKAPMTYSGETPQRAADVPDNFGPAKVPSCVVVAGKLENFALYDINGQQRWELKTDRKGKLVLLDFWATWCRHCPPVMKTLRDFQSRYGGLGLEVVGIAYEHDGTTEEQGHHVNDYCNKNAINYRQLLGSGKNCPVKTNLRVPGYPTLVLVDERGNIVWRHEGPLEIRRPDGSLDAHKRDELEKRIQSYLRTAAN
jgi:thiol-disulfide isomerase/thioredoxin